MYTYRKGKLKWNVLRQMIVIFLIFLWFTPVFGDLKNSGFCIAVFKPPSSVQVCVA